MNNIAIDGPLQGKVFIGASSITNTIIDHIRNEYAIFELRYYRSKQGFRFHSWKRIY